MIIGIEITYKLIQMDLASLGMIFPLLLLDIKRSVVVNKENGSHNPGEQSTSYCKLILFIFYAYSYEIICLV